jgi:maltooligosyltrehalose trehalohydrolase
VGNRAFGERLHHQIDLAAWRAAVSLLLLGPETPLLFMGQEWATSAPFLYFTDHNEKLGRQVTAGRRREFGRFAAFADPAVRERIPDPQAASTFGLSRLPWDERDTGIHAGVWRLHRALLGLRRSEPALAPGTRFEATACDAGTVALAFGAPAAPDLLVVARLAGAGQVELSSAGDSPRAWQLVLTSEDPGFAQGARPPAVEEQPDGQLVATFTGPAAVVVRWP